MTLLTGGGASRRSRVTRYRNAAWTATVLLALGASVNARVLEVGPGRAYPRPSDAARHARDGDVIEIATGTYRGDVAVWRQHDLVLRGRGGPVVLDAAGASAEGKGIWVTRGRNTRVEGITFRGAVGPYGNGSGIRHQGLGLEVRHCRFIGNEMGLLAHNHPRDHIRVAYSVFAHSGPGPRHNHNVYIGRIARFELLGSHVHHARIGHNVKSRARVNRILYNRIVDDVDGYGSYAIDLPEGGDAFIVGNVIQQNRFTDNLTLVSFGAERARHPAPRLLLLHNTLIDDHGRGLMVRVHDHVDDVRLINNLVLGGARFYLGPPAVRAGNVKLDADPQLRRRLARGLHYDARIVDRALAPGRLTRFEAAVAEYQHETSIRPRRTIGAAPDVGAFEWTPTP